MRLGAVPARSDGAVIDAASVKQHAFPRKNRGLRRYRRTRRTDQRAFWIEQRRAAVGEIVRVLFRIGGGEIVLTIDHVSAHTPRAIFLCNAADLGRESIGDRAVVHHKKEHGRRLPRIRERAMRHTVHIHDGNLRTVRGKRDGGDKGVQLHAANKSKAPTLRQRNRRAFTANGWMARTKYFLGLDRRVISTPPINHPAVHHMKKYLLSLLALTSAFLTGCDKPAASQTAAPPAEGKAKAMIGVSLLTLDNPFFKVIGDNITSEGKKC